MTTKFTKGDIVVSKTTGARVQVTGFSECGLWFAGICVGNKSLPDMPDRFKYYWHEWSVNNFDKA